MLALAVGFRPATGQQGTCGSLRTRCEARYNPVIRNETVEELIPEKVKGPDHISYQGKVAETEPKLPRTFLTAKVASF